MKLATLLRKSKRAVILVVLGVLAYIDYASCYVIAWKEVYHRHLTAAAIVFWVLLAMFQFLQFFYWAMIYIRGPGKIPRFKHFDLYETKSEGTAPVPDIFVCDEQGFPFWCSKCQNLKPDRLFHLSDLDMCVPRFDHFCLWIGTAIGRDNFISFIKFLQFLNVYAILVLCFVSAFTRSILRNRPSWLPHFVILFILGGFIFIVTLFLLIGIVKNTFSNSTSFDEITTRQALSYKRWVEKHKKTNPRFAWCIGKMPRVELGIRFVNIAHDDTRKVVSFGVKDAPYSNGFKANLFNMCFKGNYNMNSTKDSVGVIAVLKSAYVVLVPFAEFFVGVKNNNTQTFQSHSDEFSPDFVRVIVTKIQKQQFEYALYLSPPNNLDSRKSQMQDTSA
ncbi:palmitoyltransferase [Metschnikowia aff. pulcherrima]|uniref:Palmitoyltransferase n=1 Tax=Metschnikowia aff. pulcherrima TaxID=2163413 RepID=A0A4P6XQT6_9ASCO|nr:palmitoyltransferase [Metschnikowia aff. pulcherrima]